MKIVGCGAICVLLVAWSGPLALTQGAGSESQILAFEVASVRANVSGLPNSTFVVRPDGLAVTNYQLRAIITRAYGIRNTVWPQILLGGDPALLEKRFDIQANAGREVDAEDVSLMLQSLLADRFKLRMRSETRQLPVYELVVLREGQLGPNLRPSPHDCQAIGAAMRAQGKSQGEVIEVTATLKDSKGGLACRTTDAVHGPPPRGLFRFKLAGKLSQLIGAAEGLAGRPIIDATGLTGTFEWKVDFTPATRVVAEAPSLFAAFEQQLGLRFRPATADVEVRVIESLEQPTEN